MSWVTVGIEGASAAYGMYSSHQAANKASKMAGPHGVSGDFGNSTVDGNGNMQFNLNPQDQMFGDLARKLGMGALDRYQSNPMDALDPSQRAMGANYDSILGHNQSQYGGLADNFFKSFNNFDPQSAANDRYSLLTKQAAPGESLARNSLQSKLAAQGRLGTSGGGVDTKALYDSQGNMDLQRQLAGQDYGMQWQQQLAKMFSQFSGMSSDAGAQRFGLSNQLMQAGQANDMFAMNSAGNMQSLYQQLFAPLMNAQKLNLGNPEGAKITNGQGQNESDAIAQMGMSVAKAYG